MKVGRNDPCPCGSGRKYKSCHQAADTAVVAATPASGEVSPSHRMDERLVDELMIWAMKRFRDETADALLRLDADPEITMQLGAPLLAYGLPIGGRRVVDWYLEEQGWVAEAGRARMVGVAAAKLVVDLGSDGSATGPWIRAARRSDR